MGETIVRALALAAALPHAACTAEPEAGKGGR
jgi:hypothetical protein